jgi:CheY-like chemotaxis protein
MPTQSRLILLVDDDRDTLDAYEILLARLGHRTVSATDGGAALSAALQLLPDLIVLDIGLPGMTGIEVLRQLREDIRTSQVRVLVLTGHAFPRERDEAWRARCDRLLTKPCDTATLCEAVTTLLEAARPNGRLRAGAVRVRSTKPPPIERRAGPRAEALSRLESLVLWSDFLIRRAEALHAESRRLVVRSARLCARRPTASARALAG